MSTGVFASNWLAFVKVVVLIQRSKTFRLKMRSALNFMRKTGLNPVCAVNRGGEFARSNYIVSEINHWRGIKVRCNLKPSWTCWRQCLRFINVSFVICLIALALFHESWYVWRSHFVRLGNEDSFRRSTIEENWKKKNREQSFSNFRLNNCYRSQDQP